MFLRARLFWSLSANFACNSIFGMMLVTVFGLCLAAIFAKLPVIISGKALSHLSPEDSREPVSTGFAVQVVETRRTPQGRDWPMFGGSPARNLAADVDSVSLDFELQDGGNNVVWTRQLGSQTYGNPIVAGGRVFVGTNNGAGLRPKYPADQDLGVLACFDSETGEFQWQLSCEKLESGKANDWPLQGIASSPIVEGDRLWVVTNRCELMCLDVEGFHDNKNDGPFTGEIDSDVGDADIVWKLDMIGELGVFPLNLANSSPVIHQDLVFLLTSNGVDESGTHIPSPEAPSFIAVNKSTGKIAWQHNSPGKNILDGQWGSPAVGIVKGEAQVYFPGGDGWLYAYDAKSGQEIWKFDLNPKSATWEGGGRGERSYLVATPVFVENSVLIATGQDPEKGGGVGHLFRIDATGKGDLSPELGEPGSPGSPNPNSGAIWHYGGHDLTSEEHRFRRSISTVSVADGLVYCADLAGYVHCVDFKTGERYWEHDMLSAVWGSTMVADNKVLVGNEDGNLVILEAGKKGSKVLAELSTQDYSAIYSTPTFANGKMYLTDRVRLYCVKVDN
jgi:outer membrane protein assembly factor BamB